jgi:hypothetical protein
MVAGVRSFTWRCKFIYNFNCADLLRFKSESLKSHRQPTMALSVSRRRCYKNCILQVTSTVFADTPYGLLTIFSLCEK